MVFAKILFLIIGVIYYLGKNMKYKQRIKEYNKTGWYKESNQDLEVGLFHKYCFNYENGFI